jgi:hypothetical protein
MNFKRNKLLSITLNIVIITIFLLAFVINTQLLLELKYYYLFVTIPMLFLCLTMIISSVIKLLLVISSLIFGRHDNDEVNEYIEKIINKINDLTKYVLIGIFTTLLTSVMVLDIILCVLNEKYLLVALSIVVWILLYYILFRQIVKLIRKEIRL